MADLLLRKKIKQNSANAVDQCKAMKKAHMSFECTALQMPSNSVHMAHQPNCLHLPQLAVALTRAPEFERASVLANQEPALLNVQDRIISLI